MTRNEDGRITLTPTVLGVIVSACLAVGSGGAFAVNSGTKAEPVEQAKAVSIELNTHRNADDARDAVQNEQIRALTERLTRMEELLQRILARLPERTR